MAESYSIVKDVEISLMNKGHKIIPFKDIGQVNAILVNENGYFGGADTRGENTTAGY